MMQYGMWSELKLELLTYDKKDLLGVKLSELFPMTLGHLSKRIKKIGTRYLWSPSPSAILAGLVSYALVGCMALVFSLWHIKQLHTHIQVITLKCGLPMNTLHKTLQDTSFQALSRHPNSVPPWK